MTARERVRSEGNTVRPIDAIAPTLSGSRLPHDDQARPQKMAISTSTDSYCEYETLVPHLWDRRDLIGLRALFRRDRPGKALRRTPPKVLILENWGTPDFHFASRHGFKIDREVDRKGRPRWLLRIPQFRKRTPGLDGKKGGSPIVTELETLLLFAEASPIFLDPVVELVLKTGRRVYVHSYFTRVAQRMLLQTLGDRTDAIMSDHAHAYRPGRSRFSALEEGRSAIRRGLHWVAHVDIVRFYETIDEPRLAHALWVELPWVSSTLKTMLLRFCYPDVIRPYGHSASTGPPGCLLTGSLVAPFLSNVFATHFVDRPLEAWLEDGVLFVRYSDNIAIFGTTSAAVERGLMVVDALVDAAGLSLHRPMPDPVDVMTRQLPWLGKVFHGTSVVTPDEKLRKYVTRLDEAPIGSEEFRHAVASVRNELFLDPRPDRRLQQVARGLRNDRQKRWALKHLNEFRRGKVPPSDPEPDDRVYEAATAMMGDGA